MATSNPTQFEFLIVGDAESPMMGSPDPTGSLMKEISACWGIPLGKTVRVRLKEKGELSMIEGQIELDCTPDYPFNRHEPIRLRIHGVSFSSAMIADWVCIDP